MDEEALDDDESDDDDRPPLHVFFDIEAMQPHEQHVPNLVVAETDEDDLPVRFPGHHCIQDFLEWLDTLTQNDTRQVNVLAHNFQGYDRYFVVHQYHHDNHIVQQLRNGCKLLEVKHDRLRFIDSLSFFQMPLSAFPKTFGLTELKKGTSRTSLMSRTTKRTWDPSRPSITTCPKPCLPKPSKLWKHGIKNNAPKTYSLISNKD